jgi:hypothetical protein
VSKKSRGFQPGGQPSSPTGSTPDQPAPSASSSTPTSRSAARRSTRASQGKEATSGLAKYRNILIAGAAIVAIGVVGFFVVNGASATPYECDSLLTPAPAATGPSVAGPVASPGATPLLGFATEDLGRSHVPTGSTVRYAFCPPASGDHWNAAGRAPLQRRIYQPGDDVAPGNWVHNLEHGYVVIAYRDELTPEEEAGIQEVFDTADQGPIAAQCNLPNKVLAVPFKDMTEPFALIAWDRVLLLPEWDTQTALTFANQWQESPQHPEPAC